MVVQIEQEPQADPLLATRRGLSQLELSLDANVSTKDLSFVETGRSSPRRQLLVHLAQHLDLPIAERNRLLLAGGFAPPYLELPYDGEVIQPFRESLERLLANRAASLLWVAWPAGIVRKLAPTTTASTPGAPRDSSACASGSTGYSALKPAVARWIADRLHPGPSSKPAVRRRTLDEVRALVLSVRTRGETP